MNNYENLPIIETKMINDIKSYSKDMLPKIIETYISSSDEYMLKLKEAVSKRNARVTQKTSHSIKSISGQVGAQRVYSIASDLEETCLDMTEDEINWPETVTLLALLANEINQAKFQLEKYKD